MFYCIGQAKTRSCVLKLSPLARGEEIRHSEDKVRRILQYFSVICIRTDNYLAPHPNPLPRRGYIIIYLPQSEQP